MHALLVLLLAVATSGPLVAQAASGPLAATTEPKPADDWWNAAWSHRKRVRVHLSPVEPLGFSYRPPQAAGADDLMAAEAIIRCEVPLQAGAAREIRVVDSGGNLLPCSAERVEGRELVRVTFPARRTISGQLAGAIQDGTKTAPLSVGRDKAVTHGLRFYAMAGPDRIATLQVEAVDAKASIARVIEKTTPAIAQGTAVCSEVLTGAEYAIYYGNPKADAEGPRWAPSVPRVNQLAWRITTGAPTSVAELRTAMRANPTYTGSNPLETIVSSGNPLNLDTDENYVVAYESYIHCEIAGVYRFSIDSSGPAYLFADGRFAAQRPGYFYQTGQFEHRGKIELREGHHNLVLFSVEPGKRHVTRLAWQPVTGTVFSLPPPGLFVNRIGAEVVGFETRDARDQAFFTYRLAPTSLVAEKGKLYQFVQFDNLSTLAPRGDGGPLTHVWRFGDGEESRETSPGHLYALPPGGSASFPAILDVGLEQDGRFVPEAQHRTTVHCDPRPQEKLNLALDIVSFPNVVYHDERTSIAVRLRNATFSPVILRTLGTVVSPGEKDGKTLLSQPLRIEAKDENFCVLQLEVNDELPVRARRPNPDILVEKSATIDLDVFIGRQQVLEAGMRVVPSLELAKRGQVQVERRQIVLGPGGPYTGIAWKEEFPKTNYEVAIEATPIAGRAMCGIAFPAGDSLCTIRPDDWRVPFIKGRPYALRLRVTDARVQASVDQEEVLNVPRAAAATSLPARFEALKPFALYAPRYAQIAVSRIDLRPLEAPPAPKGEPKAPPAPPPENWRSLFDRASLSGWEVAAASELDVLQRGLGSLQDEEGRRVMLSAEIEDPDRHLRWVFLRYAQERLTRRRSVLLFGDRMTNPVAAGEASTDYVAILEQHFAKAGRPFQSVERTPGFLPTIPDIAHFARTLQACKPLPDFIVICPGLADVAQAVGHRDFTRSLDVMIDVVRATGQNIKIIIVSPPPSPRNARLSRLYTEAARAEVRRHHVAFLDLDDLLAPALLSSDDIRDWPGLCTKLLADQDIPRLIPGKTIREQLPRAARAALTQAAGNGGPDEAQRADILKGLNDLLGRPELHGNLWPQERPDDKARGLRLDEALSRLPLPEESRELLRAGLRAEKDPVKHKRLSREQVRRLNRLLFDASYPEHVNDSSWVPRWYAVPDTKGLFYENPNEDAHRAIADAIEKLLD
jgi:hypothetical protein